MKLLFDLQATQPNQSGKTHGGGKYAIEVFRKLIAEKSNMECVYNSVLYLRPDLLEAVHDNGIMLHDLSKTTLEEVLTKGNFDVYYTATTDMRSNTIPGVKNICTVHGLRELEMPRDWMMLKYRTGLYQTIKTFITLAAYKWWKGVIFRRTKRMLTQPGLNFVTVSQHTKYSCLSYLPELKERNIQVCYSPSTSTTNSEVKPYKMDSPYILIVSGNRSEKNALRALMAIDELISEHKEFNQLKAIVTGAKENAYYHKFKNPENFLFKGYVDEDVLESLYCGAKMLVYPSLNEGFGYPPLEAMRYGVPVVASSLTSISEVCGDAVLYCNPFDYKEIKGRILRLLLDMKVWEDYSGLSYKRFAEITARQNEDLDRLVKYLKG